MSAPDADRCRRGIGKRQCGRTTASEPSGGKKRSSPAVPNPRDAYLFPRDSLIGTFGDHFNMAPKEARSSLVRLRSVCLQALKEAVFANSDKILMGTNKQYRSPNVIVP